jgi:pilus assembly protein CpaE
VLNVIFIGTTDRQLEQSLHAAAMQVSLGEVAQLTALGSANAVQPDVLLLDLRSGYGLPPAVAALKRQHPSTGVVLLVKSLDPTLLLEAMRAGVNEVVAEPIDHEALAATIHRIAGSRPQTEPGRVHGFIGAKGGVGTTTIAVNVAASLGSISKPDRALMVELHSTAGDASLLTGTESRFSIVDALENTHRLDAVYFSNLVTQIAPSTDLLSSPEHGPATGLDSQRMKQVITFASTVYKHTVIDISRSDRSILDALDQVSTIYVVANQELATVKSASRLANILRGRYGRDKIGLILSRSDRDADISQADVEKAAGCSVTHIFPSNYRVALEALNKGRPVALENHNDLSASFKRFAYQLAGVRPARETARSTGLFGRLTHSRS